MVSARDYGLDFCRAGAILLVVASHVLERIFGAPAFFPQLYLLSGLVGVELFFSLSGFLIGRILLDTTEQGWSAGSLTTFYFRRWLRTLPAYYAVLVVLCLIYRGFDAPSFLFVQYYVPSRNFLPASWSLSMEEYFYLFFPLLILLFQRLGRKSPVEWAALSLIILLPLSRFGAVVARLPLPDLSFHMDPAMRLDCCAYGVLAACVQRRHAVPLGKLFRRVPPALALLASAALVCAWVAVFRFMSDLRNLADLPMAYYWGTAYFALQSPLLDAATALMVLYACHRPEAPIRLFDWPVRALSRISYSLYLTNGVVLVLLMTFGPLGRSKPWAAMVVPLAMLLTASLSYRLVEKPVLALRDRYLRDRIREEALPLTSVP